MTPDAFIQFIREFGLPLSMLVAFAWSIFTRKLVTGGELADKQNESDGWKALYERERQDRIAAEQGVSKAASASAELAEAVAEAVAEMSKARPDPYTERQQGTPRRAR